jgi:hypothetical protein
VAFWAGRLRVAGTVTPENLGQFLTELVGQKRQLLPMDDVQLYAVGMRAVCTALGKTTDGGGYSAHDGTQALVMLLADIWLR